MTKQEIINSLIKSPVDFAHVLGFTKLTDLHNEWIRDMVIGSGDESLMAHRASYKTTCVSIAISLIMILLPKQRIIFMRKTDSDVKEVIKQVSKILQDPHTIYIVKCLYGIDLKLTVQAATELNTNLVVDVKGTSQLVGIGTGASLTGKHFDRVFTDDIINVQDRISKAERDRTKMIYQELQNIKNRNGRIFNTLTPWHKDDASVLMPAPKKYDCYSTGIMSESEIAHVKEHMSPALFAANYELRHIASEDVIFDRPKVGADPHFCEHGIMHVDAAYNGEDWTAVTVLQVHEGVPYFFGWTKREHVEKCYPEIVQIYNRFMCRKLYMEDNADKGFSARDLKQKGLRATTYHESMNKYMKIVTYLKKVWPDAQFVEGTSEDYIMQIVDYNENAEHDDCPDSAASAVRQMWSKLKRGREEVED
jgi:hypothetical protein